METYDETMEYTRQAKRDFAAVGRAWFFYFAVSIAVAFLASFLAGIFGGTWLESDWGLYMVGACDTVSVCISGIFPVDQKKGCSRYIFTGEEETAFQKPVKVVLHCAVSDGSWKLAWAVLEYSYRDAYWYRDNHNDRSGQYQ